MDRSMQEWLQHATSVPVSPCSAATLSAALCVLCPWSTIDALLYRVYRLVFGTLYPAYASYKAVRTKNVKEYVKWMMYWIVFALFTSAETFTDVFLSFWFPFYYEIKIILVLWLLSPATKGSSILYRKFVHPMLSRREQDIDECIAKAKEQGYHTVVQLGTKGMNYATTVLMQTAIKVGAALDLCVFLEQWWKVGVITGDAGDKPLGEVSLPRAPLEAARTLTSNLC
uniref:Receptor expression-enhancing protein n=1 Tax=Timema tahoe TaxID=61484 RepID=A0A7R9NV83_9NEOP|nr:unnamed protein product [Timema tahoe]